MPDRQPLSPLPGRDLATLRQAAGLTQTELARTAGLTRYTVSRWDQKVVVDFGQPTPERLIEVLMPPCGARF